MLTKTCVCVVVNLYGPITTPGDAKTKRAYLLIILEREEYLLEFDQLECSFDALLITRDGKIKHNLEDRLYMSSNPNFTPIDENDIVQAICTRFSRKSAEG